MLIKFLSLKNIQFICLTNEKKSRTPDDILKEAGVIDVFDEYRRREIAYHHSLTNLPVSILTSKHK